MRIPVLLFVAIASLWAAEPGRLDFPLSTTVPDNAEVRVEVAWPRNEDGTPAPAAKDVVFYAPWWNERTFADGGVFRELARSFTVVGIFFEGQTKEPGQGSPLDPESGSFTTIERALAKARTRLDLPPGKAFGCGHSSGASLIYWAARAHPDAFEAIAPISGMAPESSAPPTIPTLHIYTFGDERAASGEAWNRLTRGTSTLLTPDPLWEARTNPIWLHLNSGESISLAVDWLRGVADLRAAHAGVLPPMAAWPVQAEASRVAATTEDHPDGVRPFPSQALAERFAAAHRRIERSDDPLTGMRVARVTPRLGAERTVFVLIAPERRFDRALYDAVLVAGKGAAAVAVQGGTPEALVALVAATAGDVAVIAPAALAGRLAAMPAGAARLVLDPAAPVAPGVLAVAADAASGTEPELRHQRLLQAACGLLARR